MSTDAISFSRPTPGMSPIEGRLTAPEKAQAGSPPAALSADVYEKNGVLFFPEPRAKLTQEEQLERAKALLQQLRSDRSGVTLGWRVTTDEEGAASLRNYYRSLEVARALVETLPQAYEGVEAFADRVSVPEDLKKALRDALGLRGVPQERAQPLGEALKVVIPETPEVLGLGKGAALACADVVVAQVPFGKGAWKTDLNEQVLKDAGHPAAVAQDYLSLARLWSRARELGNRDLKVSDLQAFAEKLPESREGALVLARLATAFRKDPDGLTFHGRPLREAAMGTGKPRIRPPAADVMGMHVYTPPEIYDLVARADPALFHLSDEGIEQLQREYDRPDQHLGTTSLRRDWHLGLLRLLDRLIDLEKADLSTFMADYVGEALRPPISEDRDVMAMVVRIIRRGSLNPRNACLKSGVRLVEHPPFIDARRRQDRTTLDAGQPLPSRRPVGAGPFPQALAAALPALDPAKKVALEDRLSALRALLSDQDPVHELSEVFPPLLDGRLDGTFGRLDLRGLSEEAQVAALRDALQSWTHIGAASVLAGLCFRVDPDVLRKGLYEIGFFDEDAREWAGRAEALGALTGEDLAFALSDIARDPDAPDFSRLALRLSLLEPEVNRQALLHQIETVGALEPERFVQPILERAAQLPESSPEREALVSLVEQMAGSGELDAKKLRQAADPEVLAKLEEVAAAKVADAAHAWTAAPGPKKTLALDGLVEAITRQSAYSKPAALVEAVLAELHRVDLAHHVPLAAADELLGEVEAKERDEDSWDELPDVQSVEIAGIELPVNDDGDKDRQAIPRAKNAELVMTDTTLETAEMMAVQWVKPKAKPMFLRGPTSAGKTALARYFAYKTQAPFRRFNCSYYTDTAELIGRYVGGELRYGRDELAAMDEMKLRRIGEDDYGLDDAFALSVEEVIEQVLQRQDEPHWVDGIVLRAAKRGEVLVLDEINLLRPAVLARLRSLFDDAGNLRVTEHRQKIVVPDANFRFVATGNPSSYQGREALSEADLDRFAIIEAFGLTQKDLTRIMLERYGEEIPVEELTKLIKIHDAVSRAADAGEIGRKYGGLAFTLRNLFKVADRFTHYRDISGLPAAALMRRETEEVYRGGLGEKDDIEGVNALLEAVMPYKGPDFYQGLRLRKEDRGWVIGDVVIPRLGFENHPETPGESAELVMTPRTARSFYMLSKAMEMGENVGLIGEKGCGKNVLPEMYAMCREQPYMRQQGTSSTDASELIGGYDGQGFKDAMLLVGGRPENVPAVMNYDEWNMVMPSVQERFNPVLDDERSVVVTEKSPPEVVRLHRDARVVMSMNPPTREYGGTNKMSKAGTNRLTMIYVPPIDTREELGQIMEVLARREGLPDGVSEVLLDLHEWVSKQYKEGALGAEMRERDRPKFGIRQLRSALSTISTFRLRTGNLQEAYRLAVKEYAASASTREDRNAIIAKGEELIEG